MNTRTEIIRQNHGLTFIEILIAFAGLGLLAAGAATSSGIMIRGTGNVKATSDFRRLGSEIRTILDNHTACTTNFVSIPIAQIKAMGTNGFNRTLSYVSGTNTGKTLIAGNQRFGRLRIENSHLIIRQRLTSLNYLASFRVVTRPFSASPTSDPITEDFPFILVADSDGAGGKVEHCFGDPHVEAGNFSVADLTTGCRDADGTIIPVPSGGCPALVAAAPSIPSSTPSITPTSISMRYIYKKYSTNAFSGKCQEENETLTDCEIVSDTSNSNPEGCLELVDGSPGCSYLEPARTSKDTSTKTCSCVWYSDYKWSSSKMERCVAECRSLAP